MAKQIGFNNRLGHQEFYDDGDAETGPRIHDIWKMAPENRLFFNHQSTKKVLKNGRAGGNLYCSEMHPNGEFSIGGEMFLRRDNYTNDIREGWRLE